MVEQCLLESPATSYHTSPGSPSDPLGRHERFTPSSLPPEIGQSADGNRSNRSVNRSLLSVESSVFGVKFELTNVFRKKLDYNLSIRRAK
jgi:hypothetical protein